MEDDEIPKKPIGLAETIFILLLIGIEEAIEVLILVITLGAGIIITEVMNGAAALAIEMYLLLRGGRGVMKLVVEPIGATINAATANLAPGKTIALGAGIWIINNPEKMEKVIGIISKTAGSAVQIAATVAGGAAGGIASRVVGGKAVGVVAGKVAGGVAEASAVAARSRMAMTTGASSGKVVGAERMIQARAQAQQRAQQSTPKSVPFQEAA